MSERKIAVVTGTSSGIGLCTAVALAQRGVRVVATMRDAGRAERLLAIAQERGVELVVRELDVTDRKTNLRVLDGITVEFGKIDIFDCRSQQ